MINKTSGSHHNFFDLMHFYACCVLQYSSKRRIVDVFPVCEAAPVLSWTSRVMLGCVLGPGGWMCISVCVGRGGECTRCGQWEHWRCATHVKFMFCAAFTKEPRNGFWGKIMPRQPEDQAKDNEAEKGNGESERYWGGKMNESLRRGNEKVRIILLDSQIEVPKPVWSKTINQRDMDCTLPSFSCITD